MQDKSDKGGKSLVLRCSSFIKQRSNCPFYCKLRRSKKDNLWYISEELISSHVCEPDSIPPRFSDVSAMMAARRLESVFEDEEND